MNRQNKINQVITRKPAPCRGQVVDRKGSGKGINLQTPAAPRTDSPVKPLSL